MSRTAGLLEALLGGNGKALESAPEVVKAIARARVSTDMQEERGLSIPEQLREIRAYAGSHGYEVVAEYHEAASAFQRESRRVEFRRMLEAARNGEGIGAILVHDFSRFSRDSVKAKTLVRELREQGIRVVSLSDPEVDPETVAGVYMEAITFAKNEAYSREVAFHTRKGCRANVQTRDEETGWCYKNGGQPLFGYKSVQLVRGEEKRGRPIIKSIWMPDDTVIAGRPIHEWAQHCLEMAAQGASLDELRDLCNENGIPARRGRYWSIGTWNSLLHPPALLKYCGHEVWNVHRKNGSIRPASEWVIVENAHPALITPEMAAAIAATRRRRSQKRFDTGYSRSRTSPYLLSGGLFKCGRCGSNMAGIRTTSGIYYVCGSRPYRKGMGCGPGVYVPKEGIEADVAAGLHRLFGALTDTKGFARDMNEELRHIWEQHTGHDPDTARRLAEAERKIGNLWAAIEDGLADTATANARLRALQAERNELRRAVTVVGQPPQIDTQAATVYQRQAEKMMAEGTLPEQKQLLRAWVADVKLAPEALEVKTTYQIPEPVMHSEVAGACFSAIHNALAAALAGRWALPRMGRRPRVL